MNPRNEYERFESSSVENRRLLREEELILSVTEAIWNVMEDREVTRATLARELGRSPSYISQILSGSRNLTLRTLADVADALNSNVRIEIYPNLQLATGTSHLSMSVMNAWKPDLVFRIKENPQIQIPSTTAQSPVEPPLGLAS